MGPRVPFRCWVFPKWIRFWWWQFICPPIAKLHFCMRFWLIYLNVSLSWCNSAANNPELNQCANEKFIIRVLSFIPIFSARPRDDRSGDDTRQHSCKADKMMLMGAPMYEGNRSILICSSQKTASASTGIGSTSIGSSRDNDENVEPITLFKCQDSSSDQKLKILPQRYHGAELGIYSRYQPRHQQVQGPAVDQQCQSCQLPPPIQAHQNWQPPHSPPKS